MIIRKLYKRGLDEILCRCVLEHERLMILNDEHASVAGGHYAGKYSIHKILPVGLWWPTMHVDAQNYLHSCDMFQRTRKLSRWDEIPFVPQVTLQEFNKLVVDFVGRINLTGKHTGACHIVTTTDYLSRWDETSPVNDCTAANILFENVVTRFGSKNILISDQGMHFVNQLIEELTE